MLKPKIIALYFFLFLTLFAVTFIGCGKKIANQNAVGDTIVCFGDSLTYGVGVSREDTYPAYLSRMLKTNIEVVNAGVVGDTAAEGLARLQRDVISKNPRLVIVFLGTNDFYQGVPYEQTHKEISEIVEQLVNFESMVVLVSFDNMRMNGIYKKGYAEIADYYNVLLVPDVMREIWDSPLNKVDWIHPDHNGNQFIAKKIYDVIKRYIDK